MWELKPINEEEFRILKESINLPENFLRILYLRNNKKKEDVEKFLYPSLESLFPPEILPDYEKGIKRIEKAIEEKEKILIWGHEDLDGISATVLFYNILKDLRAQVSFYIPVKHKKKYGLNLEDLRLFKEEGLDLVIMVDSGTTNFLEIEEAKKMGVDVIVVDHHEVLEKLPKAIAIVNPKRKDSVYPFRELSGVGVVFKFLIGLVKELMDISLEEFFSCKKELFFLTAIGTIADRVPLILENRTIVSLGIKTFENIERPFKMSILKILEGKKFNTTNFIIYLLPIFASSEGNKGVRFFITDDEKEAEEIFQEFQFRSKKWQEDAKKSLEIAEEKKIVANKIIVVKDDELTLGCLGYVAGKLIEKYQLPTIVISKADDERYVGECRSDEENSILEVLKLNKEYLIDYGGHKKACGFSITAEKLDIFIEKIIKDAEHIFSIKENFNKRNFYEAILEINEENKKLLSLLPPFGEGNPPPILKALNAKNGRDLIYTIDEENNIIIKDVL
ncbi:MAG: DHH family phosphoesterase [candidate division WOR-3 bacterium]|nr:DHH family phosphoesterase [candidate division WOR-3 bacterium]MCX7837003.1 DHH family phosphoesterase [candidate division WOR-3 bacterium]MDW8114081.1 DHH family phosphoesterase [candidate division WOR-3 bacterium]